MRAPFGSAVVLGLALMSSGGFAVVAAQETAPKGGLELFSVMVPAHRSDRCINCHGVVNPETGREHPGGVINGFKVGGDANQTGPQLCVACHTENTTGPAQPKTGPWRLAPPAMSFVDKSDRELCRQTRILTGNGSVDANAILGHLTGDPRIDEAFEGHKGMDSASPFYDPVPIPAASSATSARPRPCRWPTP